jgi:hypothetical protein
MDELAGWFVGLYIAEGSRYDGTIDIASHSNETERFERLSALAAALDGDCAVHKTSDNGSTVALKGPMLWGLIDTYVSGELASGKHLHTRCWKRSNDFLRAVLDGYLAGDGHYDAVNDRWRLGFCANDELVADLRTIGARLGISVRLRRHVHKMGEREFPGYRGELRFKRSDHHNSRDDGEIVAIRESRARKFWDIGVEDTDHLFALASGVLTHNSKPNPMPESVTDRPTSAHEHVFLLTKSARYYYDGDSIREQYNEASLGRYASPIKDTSPGGLQPGGNGERAGKNSVIAPNPAGRSCRNVWTIATHSFPSAHFATFPPALAERCIKAGTSERGCCSQCGKPWVRTTERGDLVPTRKNYDLRAYGVVVEAPDAMDQGRNRARDGHRANMAYESTTTGWRAGCDHEAAVSPCVVLDPFAGASTTLLVAQQLQRDAIGIELNHEYVAMGRQRIEDEAGLFADVQTLDDAPADAERVPEHPVETEIADLFAGDEYQRVSAPASKPLQVPRGWDTGPGAHGTIHRTGRTLSEAAE